MKKILCAALVPFLLAFCVACGGSPSPSAPSAVATPSASVDPSPSAVTTPGASVEPIIWECLDQQNPGHLINLFLLEWSDEVFEKTGGRLKINIRTPGELPFTVGEFFEAVSSNSAQMALCIVTANVAYLDAAGLTSGAFMITDMDSYNTVMDILAPYITETFTKRNVIDLFNLSHHSQHIFGKGAVPSSVADMKGLMIRTGGPEQAKFWKEFGITPVSMDNSEIISALNRNVINGMITSPISAYTAKQYDSLDWHYVIDSQWLPIFGIVNQDAFNSLPQDIQKILKDTIEAKIPGYHESNDIAYEEYTKRLAEEGLETVYSTPEEMAELKKMAIPIWDAHAQSIGGNAPEALAKIKEALGLEG